MSLTLAAATAIGAGLSFLGGLAANGINSSIAKKNIDYQREANTQNIAFTKEMNAQNIAFQREENAITRAREDNAVQRSAADMQAAGLSKTLAAGNPASAAALTAPSASAAKVSPVSNSFRYESALQKMNIASMMLDMAAKDQQLKINDKVADAQISAYEAQIKNWEEQAANTAANTVGQNISNENAQRAADDEHAYKQMQISLNDSQIRLNNANSDLREKEGASFERRLNTELDNIISSTKFNSANVGKVNNEVLEILKRTEFYDSQISHMDTQTKKLIEEIVTEKINQRILIHNLGYGEYTGMPTGIVPSGLLGNIISSGQTTGHMITSGNLGTGGVYLDYDRFINSLY